MLTNMDKLYESVAANGPVCVGLDTEISYLPTTDTAKTAGENVVAFNRALIDATKGVAGCYKVQIAYYESLGLDGMRAYAETLKLARATGLAPRKLAFAFGDAHIYQNHVEAMREVVQRPVVDDIAVLAVTATNTHIDCYAIDDFKVLGYAPHPFVKLDVAV